MIIVPIVFMMFAFYSAITSANWVAKENFDISDIGTVWVHQHDCEKSNPGGCFKIPYNFRPEFYKEPFTRKTAVETCADADACSQILVRPCPNAGEKRIVAADSRSVYCTKFLGLKEEPEKKTAWEAAQKEKQDKLRQDSAACRDALKSKTRLNLTELTGCMRMLTLE